MSAIKEKKIKYALITGAAKRIGASISETFTRQVIMSVFTITHQRKMQKNYVMNLMLKERFCPNI